MIDRIMINNVSAPDQRKINVNFKSILLIKAYLCERFKFTMLLSKFGQINIKSRFHE